MPPLRLDRIPPPHPRAEAFLRAVHARVLEPGPLPARAAYVFGSLARGEWRPGESDVDLLVVARDGAPDGALRAARRRLQRLARDHGLAAPPTGVGAAIARRFDRGTGMFQSGFVCTASDLAAGRVARAFNSSPAGVALVVPRRLVMAGVLADAACVWGDDVVAEAGLRARFGPPFPRAEVERSRAMCEGVALLGVALHPVGLGPRYAREATKWALLNGYHVAAGRMGSLDDALAHFRARGVAPGHLARFEAARDGRGGDAPGGDWRLVAGAPGAVWAIHDAAART